MNWLLYLLVLLISILVLLVVLVTYYYIVLFYFIGSIIFVELADLSLTAVLALFGIDYLLRFIPSISAPCETNDFLHFSNVLWWLSIDGEFVRSFGFYLLSLAWNLSFYLTSDRPSCLVKGRPGVIILSYFFLIGLVSDYLLGDPRLLMTTDSFFLLFDNLSLVLIINYYFIYNIF